MMFYDIVSQISGSQSPKVEGEKIKPEIKKKSDFFCGGNHLI